MMEAMGTAAGATRWHYATDRSMVRSMTTQCKTSRGVLILISAGAAMLPQSTHSVVVVDGPENAKNRGWGAVCQTHGCHPVISPWTTSFAPRWT